VVVPYVHNLLEMTAQTRPFLCFLLSHHFEQNFHERHRLERYGPGRRIGRAAHAARRLAELL
jgi:hypothetical protein